MATRSSLFSIDLNPSTLVENPERFDRSGVILWRRFFIFCPVTENEAKEHARVPRILRVDQELEGSKIKIVYYGLPRGGALRSEPEARKAGITRVPMGVMKVDGKVIGKISSRDLSRPEAALCRVIARNQ